MKFHANTSVFTLIFLFASLASTISSSSDVRIQGPDEIYVADWVDNIAKEDEAVINDANPSNNKYIIEDYKEENKISSKYIHVYEHEINTNYYTDNKVIGGDGGGAKTSSPERDFDTIKKIEVYRETRDSKLVIRGLKVKTKNDYYYKCGEEEGASEVFEIDENERIIHVELYGLTFDKNKRRSGGFLLETKNVETNERKIHDAKSNGVDGAPYNPPLGSGFLQGIMCMAGKDVDAIGFLFLRNITKAVLTDVVYNTEKIDDLIPKQYNIQQIKYDNSFGTENQTYTINGSRSIVKQDEWDVNNAKIELSSIKLSVYAGVPLFNISYGINGKLGWGGFTDASFYKQNVIQTDLQSYSFLLKVPPQKKAFVTAETYKVTFSVPFDGNMEYCLDSGHKLQSQKVKGTFTEVASTKTVIKVDFKKGK